MIFHPKSITFASGWYAIFEIEGKSTLAPLVCWAQGVEEIDGNTFDKVHGMVAYNGEIVPAPSVDGFRDYDVAQDDFDVAMDLIN
jgi:hypothetical protein